MPVPYYPQVNLTTNSKAALGDLLVQVVRTMETFVGEEKP